MGRDPARQPDREQQLGALREVAHHAMETYQCYQRTGEWAALDVAITALEHILSHTAFPLAPQEFQLGVFIVAGNTIFDRYRATSEVHALDQALGLWQQAVDATPPDSPDRAMYFSNLGIGLSDRYARSGRLEDLEAAVAAYQQAVAATPPDSPDRAMYLTNLGSGLSDRYARSGRLEDLEAAVAAYQQAVATTPPDLPARYLINLGSGLSDRYARSGRADNLEQAIHHYQLALEVYSRQAFGRRPSTTWRPPTGTAAAALESRGSTTSSQSSSHGSTQSESDSTAGQSRGSTTSSRQSTSRVQVHQQIKKTSAT